MCNVAPDVMAKLEQTVRQFLDENRMFTGYDVTIETRQRENIKLKHSDCRGAVHEMGVLSDAIDFGVDVNGETVKWTKTQINMGQGGWAWVFHPASKDANTYQPRQTQQPNTPPVGAPATAVAATATVATKDDPNDAKDSGGQNADGSFQTDYRNRLLVQTKFVRDLGLDTGNEIYIVTNPTKKTISLYAAQPTPESGTTTSTQRVERNGYIYLASATLRQAGMTGSKFRVEISDGVTPKVVEVFEPKAAA